MQIRGKNHMKNVKRIPLQKLLWCKIRYYQQLHDVSDELLSDTIGVNERTLKEYDKNASHITLEKIDRFLAAYNLTLTELIAQ